MLLLFQLLDVFGHKSNISLVFDFMDTDLEVGTNVYRGLPDMDLLVTHITLTYLLMPIYSLGGWSIDQSSPQDPALRQGDNFLPGVLIFLTLV